MKKIYILVIMLMIAKATYAQTIETKNEGQPFSTFLQKTLKNIDFSFATSGYLMDAAIDFGGLYRYRGDVVKDSFAIDINQFGVMYAALTMAQTGKKTLLPDPYTLYRTKSNDNTVPIVLLAQEYHYLRKNAVNEGIIKYENDELWHLNEATKASSFGKDTLFLATTIVNTTYSPLVSFVLPTSKILSNIGELSSISIQYQNGEVQNIVADQPFAPKFKKEGLQTAIIAVRLASGRVLRVPFKFEIINLAASTGRGGDDANYEEMPNPDFIESFNVTADKGFNGHDGLQFGTATVTIFYACEGKKITKPLIMVDGFNTYVGINQTSGNSSVVFFNRFTNTPLSPQGNARSLAREFRKEGYDLVFVDWTSGDGRDYLERSAFCLEKVIAEINTRKAANGSDEQNVLIGYSMGAAICKYAILDMQKTQGLSVNHQVKKFIAYDGALQGANIPLGAQYMIKDLGDVDVTNNIPLIVGGIPVNSWKLREFVPMLDENIQLLDSPAAQEMLIFQAKPTNAGANAVFTPPVHTNFYNKLNGMGSITSCEYHTITNGSLIGATNFPASTCLYSLANIVIPTVFLITAVAEIDVRALPAFPTPASAPPIYERKIYVNILFGSVTVTPGSSYPGFVTVTGTPSYDNSPGGTTSIFDNSLNFSLFNIFPLSTVCTIPGTTSTIRPSFIPTVSALDLAFPQRSNVFFNVSTPVRIAQNAAAGSTRSEGARSSATLDAGAKGRADNDPNLGIAGNIPLSSVVNQDHVGISLRIAGYFIFEMTKHNALKNGAITTLSTKTYNIGRNANAIYDPATTPFFPREVDNIIDYNLDIVSNGRLWINKEGKLGFTDALNNPLNLLSPAPYSVYITKSAVCGTGSSIVNVADGGQVVVGNDLTDNFFGELVVKKGAKLYISNGGLLEILGKSRVIVHSGGEIVIRNGGTLRCVTRTNLIVEYGGKLTIEPNANIDLNNSSVNYSSDVEVLVEKGGVLSLTGLNTAGNNFIFTGNGHFAFAKGNILQMATNLSLRGSGKYLTMVKMLDGATLDTRGKNVTFQQMQVTYDDYSTVLTNQGLTLAAVTAIGKSTVLNKRGTGFTTEKATTGYINASNAEFRNLAFGIKIDNSGGTKNNAPNSNYSLLINNSKFERNGAGLFVYNNVGNIQVGNGSLFSMNDVGCVMERCLGYLLFTNTTIEKNMLGVYASDNFLEGNTNTFEMIDCLVSENGWYGVGLRNMYNTIFRHCLIEKHDNNSFNNYGSGIPPTEKAITDYTSITNTCDDGSIINYTELSAGIFDFDNSNILINDGTRIVDNNFGLYKRAVDKQFDYYDALILDCAEFNNNIYGVKGNNIALYADANTQIPHTGISIRPNKFILGDRGKHLFNVCYEDNGLPLVIPSQIFIRNNYWDTPNGAGKAPDPKTIHFKSNCINDCAPCQGSNCIPYETTPEMTAQEECEIVGRPIPENPEYLEVAAMNACNTMVSDGYLGETPVHAQFNNGLAKLLQQADGDMLDAKETFSKAAALPLTEGSEICNQYIRVARAYARIYDDSDAPSEIFGTYKIQKQPTAIKIYPNPTDNILNIDLTEGEHQVTVIDQQGRSIYNATLFGQNVINTSDWQAGIYQIIVKNVKTGDNDVLKAVIVK
jgi:pimeloyl-ACP methyl ester carboxylesterase